MRLKSHNLSRSWQRLLKSVKKFDATPPVCAPDKPEFLLIERALQSALDTPSSSNRSNLIPEPDTGGLIGLKTGVEKTDPRHTLFQNRQDLLTMEAAPISAMERVPHCAITRWSSRWRRDKTVSTPI